jgi:hypothetical protein
LDSCKYVARSTFCSSFRVFFGCFLLRIFASLTSSEERELRLCSTDSFGVGKVRSWYLLKCQRYPPPPLTLTKLTSPPSPNPPPSHQTNPIPLFYFLFLGLLYVQFDGFGVTNKEGFFFAKNIRFRVFFLFRRFKFFCEKHGSVLYTNVGERYRYFRGKKIRHFNAFQEPTVHTKNIFFNMRFASFLRKCTITVKI